MSKTKQISLNAFDMNCVSHLSPGLWRYPGDCSLKYKDIEYWQNIARIAEQGLFDAVFIADVLGVYDVYRGNDLGALRAAQQLPINDPLSLATIGAAVTKNVGFGITAGVFFEHPYPFARRLSTLDHLTKGRIGWNIVTGYLPSANKNMGAKELPHDERYDVAEEYMEVIYKLLEGSWEDDAVILDRESGDFANPYKVHHIGHHGKYYDVPGIHLCEPSIQRTPVLFQAGNSPRGRAFSAKHAEAMFIAPPLQYAKTAVAQIRQELIKAGRDPYSAKIYLLATIITDESESLAQAKYKDLLKYAHKEGALVVNSGWLGVDLSKYKLDEPLDKIQSNAMLGKVEAMSNSTIDGQRAWTLGDLLKLSGIGAPQAPRIIGSPKQVADTLQDIIAQTDADGFNLSYATTPGTFEDVVRYVVPELQKRDAYKHEYAKGSLRNKLFGKGDRLDSTHIGSQYRVGGALSTIDDYTDTGRPRPAE
ncbi:LLM class flavin-dependent oxidoreductase [Helicobacter jaachi]|uniref:LLM class flavin-dependent oxidoreductase n=1 Tax=Helicobacter jaachi TaxID=1677920 RepID=A0A4U8TB22_9HELI|nr:LLM class flavin-dependent oxidoreductase [Helicobacter jaachi]TLD96368.1 LLM class flavin-dependent oxidoreductase [Helicobacter jaachi]